MCLYLGPSESGRASVSGEVGINILDKLEAAQPYNYFLTKVIAQPDSIKQPLTVGMLGN